MNKLILAFMMVMISSYTFAKKTAIYSRNAPEPIGTYSQAIQVDHTIYISGQIPIDPMTGNMVKGDFKQQVKQVIANLDAITKAAGGSLNDIVKLNVYLTDLSYFPEVNELMMSTFTKPYPARAVIEIKALPKNATVEIEAIMHLNSKK